MGAALAGILSSVPDPKIFLTDLDPRICINPRVHLISDLLITDPAGSGSYLGIVWAQKKYVVDNNDTDYLISHALTLNWTFS